MKRKVLVAPVLIEKILTCAACLLLALALLAGPAKGFPLQGVPVEAYPVFKLTSSITATDSIFSSINAAPSWEQSGNQILHQIGGDDFQSFYGCSPRIKVVANPLPVAQLASCDSMVFSSGLLKLVQHRSEYAFVIAHEAAHQMLGHLHHQDKRRHSWSLNEEISADLLALKLLSESGFDRRRAASLLERLENFGADQGVKLVQIHPTLGKRRVRIMKELGAEEPPAADPL